MRRSGWGRRGLRSWGCWGDQWVGGGYMHGRGQHSGERAWRQLSWLYLDRDGVVVKAGASWSRVPTGCT